MCTNISLSGKSKDNPVLSARTMDYIKKLPTYVNYIPRGQSFPEVDLPGELHWKNKYGFIGIGHLINNYKAFLYSDGLNETGLSAAALWLPGSTYPESETGNCMLYHINFVNYVLGNFQNIYEVKTALNQLTITDIRQGLSFTLPPLHYIISDAAGNHLIIEFINGEIKTYINKLGVLSNEPSYDWHLMNLGNYENLSLRNNHRMFMDYELNGSGQLGSPGDPTSPSRFVRAAFLQKSAFNPKNKKQSIGLAYQILQNLAIPCGTVLNSRAEHQFYWTQWGIIRDHTNKSLYFYSAFNSRLYGISLKKINFTGAKQKQINLDQPIWYKDITKAYRILNYPLHNTMKNKFKTIPSYKNKIKTVLLNNGNSLNEIIKIYKELKQIYK